MVCAVLHRTRGDWATHSINRADGGDVSRSASQDPLLNDLLQSMSPKNEEPMSARIGWIAGIGLWTAIAGCSSAPDGGDGSEEAQSSASGIVCTHAASDPNVPLSAIMRANNEAVDGDTPVISNYTAWPTYNQGGGAYDPNIVLPKTSADAARKNI